MKILQPDLSGNERKYVLECLEEGWISSQGRFVTDFETTISRRSGHRRCLATSNGTVALHLAMDALGIGPGDEVIVPDITFGATLNAIIQTGAIPVLVDIDADTWNIDTNFIVNAITSRTKAILYVPLYGNPSDLLRVVDICNDHHLYCVIDAAEAVGAEVNGVDIGQFGDCVTYSFFGNKTLTTGEGGAIIFRDEGKYHRAKIKRDHGMDPNNRYHHVEIGYNYRMTNIQAAIGVAQFERIAEILKAKKEIVNFYMAHLNPEFFRTQKILDNHITSNWIFGVCIEPRKRAAIEYRLLNMGIEYRRGFEPMHIQPAFNSVIKRSEFKNSIQLHEQLLLLPSHTALTQSDLLKVVSALEA